MNCQTHRLDNDEYVFCYMDEFYPLSNFAAFRLVWNGIDFDTSEHAYHWMKFTDDTPKQSKIRDMIVKARSAHDAFKIAEIYKDERRADWEEVKVDVMEDILTSKIHQHDYVYKKLMETGDRIIIEDSWRDNFWGWGEDKNGQNMLGKLWMKIRDKNKNRR